eukprot:TRINITY_DN2551_c0_g1_i8.p1 TRINITY_DN2551_c0_g1~~TRINITY_DN2551_c0_g1_i8.p1  ORF type:complete len:189 (-),score=22.48 TRINITY_DN2551_c0_g1_i8:88-654(-)
MPLPITEEMARALPQDQVRPCKKCHSWKTPRTHHCSVCERCIQRMDHHCIWVGNCVGSHNHKYFVLFLFYIVLTCGSASACYMVLLQVSYPSPMAGASGLITLVVAATIALFGSLHCFLLFNNRTTLECMSSCDSEKDSGFSTTLGWKENFKEVMGDSPAMWFLPCGGGTRGRGKHLDGMELSQVISV